MPGTPQTCDKCKAHSAVLVVRAKPTCHDCFARYVHTKAIKRLESFRVNFAASPAQPPKVLVPLSHGIASTTLLHILDLHLNTQRRRSNRTGFAISVLAVHHDSRDAASAERLAKVRERYSDHEYASLPLHHVFELLPHDAPLRHLVPECHGQQAPSAQEQLASMIASLVSATARADVLTTLRTRLIVEYAKQTGCESILWGDSTTRLAEKTLAETAKGRGFSLPWQISDGTSPFGINFHYPLRDVLKKELVSYVDLAEPALSSLVYEPVSEATQASMSSKNTTIDHLMKQYFESVEENFPSIVSNVVRTTGKLAMPKGATSDIECSLCGMPVSDGRFGIHGWGGDQHDADQTASEKTSQRLCYGCTRSVPQGATTDSSK
ncbi:Cytoplasmic tRNA 2-thiolation protein 2 [Pleosporales sp. CAS-2024a]